MSERRPHPAFWQLLVRAFATGCCGALAMFMFERGEDVAGALAFVVTVGMLLDHSASQQLGGGVRG